MEAEPFFAVDRLSALTAFAFASVWTPGPNNIMLANSGASFGFARTLPHALGVALGFPLMLFGVALGLGEAFEASPALREGLRWVGAGLLLYLGWRTATAGRLEGGEGGAGRPLSFVEACAFQWINPKAWVMAIGVASTFLTGAAPMVEAAAAAAVFGGAGLTSAHGWAAFGAWLRRFLHDQRRLRAFNLIMGLLVAGCVVFLMID